MFKFACVTALMALAGSAASAATFNTFTDRAAFLAATTNVFVENFNAFEAEVSFNGQDLTIGDLTIRNDSGNSDRGLVDVPPHIFGLFDVDTTPNANLVVNKLFNSVDFSFANPVTAFGADFAALNNDALMAVFSVLGDTITPPVQNGTTVQFFGFTSDMSFSSLSMVGPNAASDFDGFSADNITFGQAATVPLPAPAMLLLSALGGLFIWRRRSA